MAKIADLNIEKLNRLEKYYQDLLNKGSDVDANKKKLEIVIKEKMLRLVDSKKEETKTDEVTSNSSIEVKKDDKDDHASDTLQKSEKEKKRDEINNKNNSNSKKSAKKSSKKTAEHLSIHHLFSRIAVTLFALLSLSFGGLTIAYIVVHNAKKPQEKPKVNKGQPFISKSPYAKLLEMETFLPALSAKQALTIDTGDGVQKPTMTIIIPKTEDSAESAKVIQGEVILLNKKKMGLFFFESLKLTNQVIIMGDIPLILASKDSMELSTTLNLNGGDIRKNGNSLQAGIGICGGKSGKSAGIWTKLGLGKGGQGEGCYGEICGSGGGYGGSGAIGKWCNNSAKISNFGNVVGNGSVRTLQGGNCGGASSNSPSAAGGGAILLFAYNDITLATGTSISVNGGSSHFAGGGGAGSGGSIVLIARNIVNDGKLSAHGGAGNIKETKQANCGGGGGRIAIYYNEELSGSLLTSTSDSQAGDGTNGKRASGNGTVWYSHIAHYKFDALQTEGDVTAGISGYFKDSCVIRNDIRWTNKNEVKLRDGKFDKALELNGKNELLAIDSDSIQSLGEGSFSILFWFSSDYLNNNRVLLAKKIDFNIGDDKKIAKLNRIYKTGFHLHTNNGKLTFQISGAKSNDENSFTTYQAAVDLNSINFSEWHHIAMVRDTKAGRIELYIDGKEVDHTTEDLGKLINPHPLLIGCGMDPGPFKYTYGAYDSMKIYNIALSPKDIQQLMQTP